LRSQRIDAGDICGRRGWRRESRDLEWEDRKMVEMAVNLALVCTLVGTLTLVSGLNGGSKRKPH
jgi:hypothetical protein